MALSSPVRKWLRYALDDLKVGRSIENLGSSHWRACAYHGQQAAEKAIKGYLAHHQIRFPKTHNIGALVDLVAGADVELARRLRPAKRLTKYAIEYRYPSAAKRAMTQGKAHTAIVLAGKVFDLVAESLRARASE